MRNRLSVVISLNPCGIVPIGDEVIDFGFTPPRAMPLTYVNAPDPNEIRPAEFSWVLNGSNLATGAQASQRMLPGIPPEANLPSIERYRRWRSDIVTHFSSLKLTLSTKGPVYLSNAPERFFMRMNGRLRRLGD